MAIPGGAIQDFWDAVATTSIPHASVDIIDPAADETASTKINASELLLITSQMSFNGFLTPVELSLCVIKTALILEFSNKVDFTSSGSANSPYSNEILIVSHPYASEISANLSPNHPIDIDKILSPGDVVLTIAVSIAPVPDAVIK